MSCDFEEMVRYCGVLKHTNADEEGEEEKEVDEEEDEEEEEEGSAQSTTVSRTLSMQAQAFKTVREGVRVYVFVALDLQSTYYYHRLISNATPLFLLSLCSPTLFQFVEFAHFTIKTD